MTAALTCARMVGGAARTAAPAVPHRRPDRHAEALPALPDHPCPGLLLLRAQDTGDGQGVPGQVEELFQKCEAAGRGGPRAPGAPERAAARCAFCRVRRLDSLR